MVFGVLLKIREQRSNVNDGCTMSRALIGEATYACTYTLISWGWLITVIRKILVLMSGSFLQNKKKKKKICCKNGSGFGQAATQAGVRGGGRGKSRCSFVMMEHAAMTTCMVCYQYVWSRTDNVKAWICEGMTGT